MQNELYGFWTPQYTDRTLLPSLLTEGELLAYNERSVSGQPYLAKAIASDVLYCHAAHVISVALLVVNFT